MRPASSSPVFGYNHTANHCLLLCLPFGEFEAVYPAVTNRAMVAAGSSTYVTHKRRFAEFIGVKPAFKRPSWLAIASGVLPPLQITANSQTKYHSPNVLPFIVCEHHAPRQAALNLPTLANGQCKVYSANSHFAKSRILHFCGLPY